MRLQDSHSDAELIIKARSGNRLALEMLFGRYTQQVYGLCLRYLQNRTDAEDAAQETFIKVWRNLKKIDLDRSFHSWLLTIAKNTCLDQLKKKKIIPFSAFDTEDGDNTLADTLPADVISQQRYTDQSLSAALLQSAVNKLSPEYQEAVKHRNFENSTFRETADDAGLSINTVKSRYRRALFALRKMLL